MSKADIYTTDYATQDTPESVQRLKPVLYRDGSHYCCLLGSDPQAGIFGCGESPAEAMQDFDRAYQYLVRIDPELKSIYGNEKGLQQHWVGWRTRYHEDHERM